MSYYGPNFGNIDSGWYETTTNPNYAEGRKKIDRFWNSKCDEILLYYLKKYGTFFTAFEEEIAKSISEEQGFSLSEQRYYEYYLQNRAFVVEKFRKIWIDHHNSILKKSYNCSICDANFPLLDAHPSLVRNHGIPPNYCRRCDYLVERYRPFWDDAIKLKLIKLVRNISSKRSCEICSNEFILEGQEFKYGGIDGSFLDLFYPNLFADICPKCFSKAFKDYRKGSRKTQLQRLYALFEYIGKVPTQQFMPLFYLCRDHDSILGLFEIMRKLRTPEGLIQEFGSFFAALVESGILPEGTRRMTIGTLVLANDGDLCLSIAEKEIDDFLYSMNIEHRKEIYYPGKKWRCDWELLNFNRQIFVEYFGLMSNPDYAKRAREKRKLAKKIGITLIELFPEEDCKAKIINELEKIKQLH